MNGLTPLVIMMACNMWVAYDLFVNEKNYPMALVFTCYTLSGIGFIWGLYYNGNT